MNSADERRLVKALLIYRSLPRSDVLALRIELDDHGQITFVPGQERADEAMRMLKDGVSSPQTGFVEPAQGDAYMRAVFDVLARSSVWHAIPEVPAPPEAPAPPGP